MKILTFLILLLPISVFSQSVLSGKITSILGQPFNYCKLLISQYSTVLATAEADSLGNYSFKPLTDGNYFLQIKLPFKTIDTTVIIFGNTHFDLETEDGNTIDEVVIEVQKPMIIRKVDRTIFNPSDIPALVGGNASDVIEFAPGVFINGENIQLSNGSSAKVMINDKLIPLAGSQLISFIKSIPTEDIQYIELIPIAPVKYAASSGGLINIKLVVGAKSKLSKGSLTADLGQRFYSQQSLMANYAYRKNKFSFYSNLSADNNKSHHYGVQTIEFDTVLWRENYSRNNKYQGISGGLGMNYELSPKSEIGILCFTNMYDNDVEHQSNINNTNDQNVLLSRIENRTGELTKNRKNSVNLNLVTHLDSAGRQLDVNLDYTNFKNNGTIDYLTRAMQNINDSSFSETNLLTRAANLFSGGVDYVHPIKNVTFTFGGRYSYTTNNYKLSVFNNKLNPNQEDTLKSNIFNYEEHIQALYSSIDWKVKSWSFQVGFRGENTVYSGKSSTTGLYITNNYFQLVPKVFAMYETKKGSFWNLSYSRDFYRPSYDELNPFRYYTSSYQFRVGNPYLKPSVYHSVSVSTMLKDFQFSLIFDYSLKGSTSVTVYDELTQIQQTTTANLYSSKGIVLFTNYNKSVSKRLSLDLNLLLLLSTTMVNQTISAQQLTAFTASTNVEFRYLLDRKKTFFLKLTGSYISPYFQQITRQSEFPYTSLLLTKNLLRNRLNVRFSFGDPFKLMKITSTTRTNQTVLTDSNYFDTQSISLSVSFKFGNNRMNVDQRSTDATGEGSRIGK